MKSTILLATALTLFTGAVNAQTNIDPIVGTWAVMVPGPTPEDTFYAIQTFHHGGTFTENSSLLPRLGEGPAQGTWVKERENYKLTFLLFIYDEERNFVGYIRVRCTVKLSTPDRIDADTIIDLIEPDGHVIDAIAVGPFFGLRQKIDATGPIADVPGSLSGDRDGRGGRGLLTNPSVRLSGRGWYPARAVRESR